MGALLNDGLQAIVERSAGIQQSEIDASYQTFPEIADFEVSVEWSARRIFNFMRATAHLGQPYHCRFQGKDLQLRRALAYSDEGKPDGLGDIGQIVEITCSTGTLVASYYH